MARARWAATFLESAWRQVAAGGMLVPLLTSSRVGGSRKKQAGRKQAGE